jgi:2-dehydro-3-deoxyphosphooctonate aldolase (KDO 8-P synthase)
VGEAMENVSFAGITIGQAQPLALIAGPCVIETRDHALKTASRLAEICTRLSLPLIYKSSYDKANRSSGKSARGPGIEEGLRILAAVKSELGLPVLTDVHETTDVLLAAEVVDILQIPAFLCRQTSLVEAAARSGRVVNVKKGQFLSPWDAAHIAEKVRQEAGVGRCLLTERGSSFGYNNLVVDYRSIPVMRGHGVPVVFDATHSVQLPGGGAGGKVSGGMREFIPTLAVAAAAAGADAFFFEAHEDPASAPSDASTMIPMADLEGLLRRVRDVSLLVRGHER